jgi:ribosomal protein S16
MYKSKVIRLRRKGAKFKALFDICVINRKLKSNSQKVEKIGYLIPFRKKIFAINTLKLASVLNKGVFLNEKVRTKLVNMAVPVKSIFKTWPRRESIITLNFHNLYKMKNLAFLYTIMKKIKG